LRHIVLVIAAFATSAFISMIVLLLPDSF
jgi:hypothetical protein